MTEPSPSLQSPFLSGETTTLERSDGAPSTTNSGSKMNGSICSGDVLDFQIVISNFNECADHPSEELDLQSYINGYSELVKIFSVLGTVFGFVVSDVSDKLNILQRYLKKEPTSYATIVLMIKHELSHNMTTTTKPPSGSRTLLRLHRALEFIQDFLQRILEMKQTEKLSHVCHASYTSTLSKYHTWLVRKAVSMGTSFLPSRDSLLESLSSSEPQLVLQQLQLSIEAMNNVYRKTQKLYEDNTLLTLP